MVVAIMITGCTDNGGSNANDSIVNDSIVVQTTDNFGEPGFNAKCQYSIGETKYLLFFKDGNARMVDLNNSQNGFVFINNVLYSWDSSDGAFMIDYSKEGYMEDSNIMNYDALDHDGPNMNCEYGIVTDSDFVIPDYNWSTMDEIYY